MTNTYIAHHGILGQKWGVRRFQNPDGSLKAAGARRYNSVSRESIKQRKETIKTLNNKINVDPYSKNRQKNKQKLSYEIEQLKNDKLKLKVNQGKINLKGRNYYNKKVQQYMDQGFSKEEAEIRAYRSNQGRKYVMAAAGVTLAAVAAYGGYKYYKNNVDGTLKAGKKLQNITSFMRNVENEALYTSHNIRDNIKYRGLYGAVNMNDSGAEHIYKNTINIKKNIKVASHKSAEKIAVNLFNTDKQYAKEMKDTIDMARIATIGDPLHARQHKMLTEASKEIMIGKPGKNFYKASNWLLAAHDNILPGQDARNKKLYDALKKSGYSALRDYNDESLSGYHSVSSNIIFDGAKNIEISNIIDMKNNVTKMGADRIAAQLLEIGDVVVPYAGITGAYTTGIRSLANKKARSNEIQIANKYRKEHPGTKLSTEQIIKNYYNFK